MEPSGVGPRLYFQRAPEEKRVKNRGHLDVRVGTGPVGEERLAALEAECAWLVPLGAVHVETLYDGEDPCIPTDEEGRGPASTALRPGLKAPSSTYHRGLARERSVSMPWMCGLNLRGVRRGCVHSWRVPAIEIPHHRLGADLRRNLVPHCRWAPQTGMLTALHATAAVETAEKRLQESAVGSCPLGSVRRIR